MKSVMANKRGRRFFSVTERLPMDHAYGLLFPPLVYRSFKYIHPATLGAWSTYSSVCSKHPPLLPRHNLPVFFPITL